MTFDEFKADFLGFLENSNVNLGRKMAKTRQLFIDEAKARFDAFGENFIIAEICDSNEEEPPISKPKPMSNSVICIKPKDKNRALDIGKGAHAMTPGESMRADEQLDRCPFGNNKGKKDNE